VSEAARAAILARVRARQRNAGAAPVGVASARGPQPTLPSDLVAHFIARALPQSCTVERLARCADIPAAVAAYLAEQGIAPRLVCWPVWRDLDWPGAGLEALCRPVEATDEVGLTGCFCALAETGTLMLVSGNDSPSSTSLLPETHIAVVPAAAVVATMEDGFARLHALGDGLPRAVNFVSGPSRTGDIEQTIVLGAHGPCRVHLLMIDGA
jgi:L-lactate dehydrogenase complex protein LldG